MGYIMPITQYEYIQYASRTAAAEEEQPIRAVSGVAPVRPINFYGELQKEIEGSAEKSASQISRESKNLQLPHFAHYKSSVPREIIEQAATELTGKGWFVNQTV
ncbi:hypothetical protein SAMN05443252_101309 [Bacillus sp. OV322]|uniref:hypothetical protein n=1 Tax=Bacillus sp. OV322 TaxID=1882764 RepID=UPI0008ED038F|nr:hypothetical protein [Bacillus sp. OV322]SFB98447.1 hypothetical protein SAMN05443252_101309 [Bacillus sp. OV322]